MPSLRRKAGRRRAASATGGAGLSFAPMRRIVHLAAATLCVGAIGSPLAVAQETIGAILCHDPVRGTVSRTLPAACAGRRVDANEASAVDAARAQRLQRVVGAGAQGAAPPPATREGRLLKASASGFFVNETGDMLTNFHAVRGCGAVTATTIDRASAPVRVVVVAAALDLAVLRADGVPPAVATFSRDPTGRPPGKAIVVGYTLFGKPGPSATATAAAVSAAALADESWHFAFAARIFPGHSGSPVLDEFGEVIGVVHARARRHADGSAGTGPGLAIGVQAIGRFLADNRIGIRFGETRERLDDTTILARARRYVVRVECWS